eukprot:Pgem_evm1s1252
MDNDLCISQGKYVHNLLHDFELVEAKGHKNLYPIKEGGDAFTGPYLELVGSLNYLSQCTRPDITTMVSMLSRFNTKPTTASYEAAKNTLRYLKQTKDYGLMFRRQKGNTLRIEAYCD